MYIVLSGNTGTGKSSLGSCLREELAKRMDIAYIDEKSFHHELLAEMFNLPREYAFLIQLNFLLQRTLRIKHLTENNRIFLMERSLGEDFLFAYRHYQLKNISPEEFKIYEEFWKNCLSKVASPSLHIYLYSKNVALLSKQVIKRCEQEKRKQELPDKDLRKYIEQMNFLYDEWFENLETDKIKVPVPKSGTISPRNVTNIIDSILSLVDSDKSSC